GDVQKLALDRIRRVGVAQGVEADHSVGEHRSAETLPPGLESQALTTQAHLAGEGDRGRVESPLVGSWARIEMTPVDVVTGQRPGPDLPVCQLDLPTRAVQTLPPCGCEHVDDGAHAGDPREQ